MLDSLYQQFLAFGGVGAAVALLIAVLKLPAIISKGKVVIIPDGWAGNAAALANVVLFAVFVFGKIFYPDFDFIGLDADLVKYAEYGQVLLGLILQLLGSSGAYKVFKAAAPKAVSYSASGVKA